MHVDLGSQVRSVPWDEPISVLPDTSVRRVATLLRRFRIGAVLVRADAGHDVGVVSERDVVGVVADGRDPDTVRAADVMTGTLVCVDVGAPLADVVDAMVVHQVRHVGVTDGDEVVGVLSARDVLRVVAAPRLRSGP